MLVLKSRISHIIKKEKQKERKICQQKNEQELKRAIKKLENNYSKTIKELELQHKSILLQKEKELKKLKKEIDKNHTAYQEIRNREKHLDSLTFEIEDEIERMVLKVQESIQPIYRTRAKVETVRRHSVRKNDKVESIFKAVK